MRGAAVCEATTLRRVERRGLGGWVGVESVVRKGSEGRFCVRDLLLSISATIYMSGLCISYQEADVCGQTVPSEGVTGEGLEGKGGWGRGKREEASWV